MKIVKVYLSGPMYVGREEATAWRNEFKRLCNEMGLENVYCYDPCNRFHDKWANEAMEKATVMFDKFEIENSDFIIANTTKPGWGTPMEVFYAYDLGKNVIAIHELAPVSIWVKQHSYYVADSVYDAVVKLKSMMQARGDLIDAVR